MASSSNAGCEPGDFAAASATAPQIALIQRGTCDFIVKARNARQAGYDAVIIFNEGQEGRQELLMGTLGGPFDLPVVGVSFATGAALQAAASAGEVIATVTTATFSEERETTNVLARSALGDASQAVIVGAHLDSVLEGPGINDNGSGTSTILEIAEEMSELGVRPRRQLRFAFWGAEENGLLGSEHYVAQLTPDEVGEVYANLNFDMLGSAELRPVRLRRRRLRDEHAHACAARARSSGCSSATSPGRVSPPTPTPFNGRSDYGPFIAVGIPAGGLFAAPRGSRRRPRPRSTAAPPELAYDPCYHEACDDITNLSTQALAELGDAAPTGR